MDIVPGRRAGTGDVGYIISGIKTSKVKVGDTITHIARPCSKGISGFEEVEAYGLCRRLPIETEDF